MSSQTGTSNPADAKAYYGYLFEPDKKPTKVLEQLLRGISNYIRDELGNKEVKKLTPEKLASFYKAVGGNYDSLFVDVPHPSISWIYASIGCQHTLQPTNDDFVLPSIPALTTRGFVRWESIEILLGPEEHVPFMQYAVKNWDIKNPETKERFPIDLPAEAFPSVPDSEIEKWHNDCAEKLRIRSEEVPRPDLPPRPKVSSYVHVRSRPTVRVDPEYPRPPPVRVEDYYEPRTTTRPPFTYKHVDPSQPHRPVLSHSPSHRARQFLAPEESPRLSRSRRRSYPENIGSPIVSPPIPDIKPHTDSEHIRRHSHPRQARRGSVSSDASSEDESPPSPTSPVIVPPRQRAHTHSHSRSQDIPPASVRYMTPATAPAVSVPQFPEPERPPHPHPPRPRHRERLHDEEEKRRSFPGVPIDVTGKLSMPFLLGKRNNGTRDSSRSGNVRWKDLNPADLYRRPNSRSEEEGAGEKVRRGSGGGVGVGSGGSGGREERDSREYKRRDRDRERDRERDRDRERERDLRPRMEERRRSSHEDPLRRDRDRERDRERERDAIGRSSDSRSFRERDRERRYVGGGASPVRVSDERERERRHGSPIRGVDGRRYPAHTHSG